MDYTKETPRPQKAGIMDIFMVSLIRAKELALVSVKSSSRFIGYVIFMSFLVSLMIYAVPTASKITSFGGFKNLFMNKVPAFEYTDGTLTADKAFEMKLSNVNIIMDTRVNEFVFGDFEREGIYIAIGAKNIKMVTITDIKDDSSYQEVYSYPNSLVLMDGMNNMTLVKMRPFFYIMIFFIFMFSTALAAGKYLLAALFYAFIFKSLTSVSKLPMTFLDSFHMCFYAQTLGIILVNMNMALGNLVSPFIASAIGIVITVVIIHKAMGPHMPDIDEIMGGFSDRDSK